MKIPYIKIYTADLLAKTRRLSAQEIGEAVIAACELAFEGSTDYEQCLSNASENAQAFFNMLKEWAEDSKEALKVKRERAQKGAQTRWEKSASIVGAKAYAQAMLKHNAKQCHTETETETETEIKKDSIEKKTDPALFEKPKPQKEVMFEQFWAAYPKQRAGAKDKALSAYFAALKRHRELTARDLVSKAQEYAQSNEVARGYAKGAQAWLNDDRFLQDYKPSVPGGNALQDARKAGQAVIDEMFGGGEK